MNYEKQRISKNNKLYRKRNNNIIDNFKQFDKELSKIHTRQYQNDVINSFLAKVS